MVIKSECLICKCKISNPKVGQITCGARPCKKKYKSIWKEAKAEGIEMPMEI